MELIKLTRIKITKLGNRVKYGLFLCPYCLQEVEKSVSNGKRDKSCGCYHAQFSRKHGDYKNKLYTTWLNMKHRCFYIKDVNYKNYGGRGITICPEWAESYIVFRDWALNNGYQENLEIDRINNNGNYEPSNCRLVTHSKNNQNKRNNKLSIEKVNEIRELYKTGYYTQRELSKKYNTTKSNIWNVVNNLTWGV